MAIDRDNYKKVLVNGAGTPTRQLSRCYRAFSDEASQMFRIDMEGAKKLLEEGMDILSSDGDGIPY